MNAKQIARVVEVLFQGGPGDEGEAPLPHSQRFQWKDPKTGKAPPPIPRSVRPTKKDMRDLDATRTIPGSSHPGAPAPQARPAGDTLPDDRTGSVPMSGMIGKGEMATIDDLLDQYLQMQRSQGPEAAKAWFDKYRTAEFESILQRMADLLLG